MVSGASASDVEELPFRVVDFLQVGVVADGLDAFLRRNDFIVAGHHDHGAELEPFGEMHSAESQVATERFHMLVQDLERDSGCFRGGNGAVAFYRGADE